VKISIVLEMPSVVSNLFSQLCNLMRQSCEDVYCARDAMLWDQVHGSRLF
jgi:hypothetical protein